MLEGFFTGESESGNMIATVIISPVYILMDEIDHSWTPIVQIISMLCYQFYKHL